jgi:hypothetical protein
MNQSHSRQEKTKRDAERDRLEQYADEMRKKNLLECEAARDVLSKLPHFDEMRKKDLFEFECQEKKKPLHWTDGRTSLTKYLELDTWTPEQAACLVAGINPESLVPLEVVLGKQFYMAVSLSGLFLDASGSYGSEKTVWRTGGMDYYYAFTQRERVLELLNSREVATPKIKLSDFFAWCISKRIDTTWLSEVDANKCAPAAKVKTVHGINPSGDDWTDQACMIADECFDKDTANGCRDSLKNYSRRVMEIMQERGVKGPRGIIDNENTVKREALQGKKWWANKLK